MIVVSGVPGYACARKELLPLASVFASLDDSVKETCKDVESRFQIGWSHGIETLQNGQVDTFKGTLTTFQVVVSNLSLWPRFILR